MAVATNARKATAQRIKALTDSTRALTDSDENLQKILTVVRNQEEPVDVRLAAIDSLATAAFAVARFEPYRNDYIATLQEVSDDPNPEIRESALGLACRREEQVCPEEIA